MYTVLSIKKGDLKMHRTKSARNIIEDINSPPVSLMQDIEGAQTGGIQIYSALESLDQFKISS